MKISSASTAATVVRRFTIEADHPIVWMAYASRPRKVRIARGTITYIWNGQEWIVKDAWSIDVAGPVLKNDGTDSKNDHSRHPDDIYRFSGQAMELTEEFEWLNPIIDLLRPVGTLALADPDGTEVD